MLRSNISPNSAYKHKQYQGQVRLSLLPRIQATLYALDVSNT